MLPLKAPSIRSYSAVSSAGLTVRAYTVKAVEEGLIYSTS